MGILSRIRPMAMDSGELYRQIISTYGGGTTATGLSVTSDSAMRAMSVHSCVRIKAFSIAQLPLRLYRKNGQNKEIAEDSPLYPLLHDMPNAWLTSPEFWGMVSACLDLRGNAFILKSGLPGRPVRELIPLAIGAVQEVIQGPDYRLFYKVLRPDTTVRTAEGDVTATSGSVVDTIPGDRIMHIRGLMLNGYMGLNPIAYARESVGLALATEKHGAKLFGHGTMIGGTLQMPAGQFFADRNKAKAFVDSFNESYSSIENAHKTALLENGVTWNKMAMTSVDSQFLEARGFQKKEIVDLFFGNPLSMMTDAGKSPTFASAEQFGLSYVIYALMPYLVNIEKAVYRDLLTTEERRSYYAKFQVNGLLRGTAKERAAFYRELINAEVISPNEARGWEDLNPYPGGDEFRTRTSSVREPASGGVDDPDKGGEQ